MRQRVVVGLAEIHAVQVGQLVVVHPGGAAVDVDDVEQPDGFLASDNLQIAVGPAQPHQIVAQRVGQEALFLELQRELRAVAFGQFLAVRAVDHRQVGPDRNLPAHALIDLGLAGGVVQVVVAADHVGDPHVVVIDDHGEVIGRRAVRAQQDQVVEILVLEGHVALHLVGDQGLALSRGPQPDHIGLVRVIIAVAITPGRTDHPALGAGGLALMRQFVGGHVATIGRAARQHLLHDRAVAIGAGELEHRLLVRRQAQPAEAIEDRLHRRLGGALAIGVLDAQQELAADMLGVKPVEKRGPSRANVHVAGGRGGDTGDDGAVGHRGFD
ncbi:hypothetical protein GALL_479880 [mine drainage metagenome]|uniref:Uncharacterized protein n=1 Tax=mine drainage metagenome TaxID=410659 RepID=A0A1J5PRM3_9ZZZZ